MMTGCSQFGNQGNSADAFVTEILSSYPDLADKKYEIATVARTVDGDTFATETGDKVRLIGVNTPESTKEVEFFGKEASSFSRERLTGKKVYMFQDTGDKDRYGRLLRYIFVENEPTMFNETLLIEGYANTMTVPPNVMFSEKFVQLEREARESDKGLWGDAYNAAPESNKCDEPKIKGNINSKNEKIFHIPGGRYYDQTKAEEMFCTEEEAIDAGFRKSKN
jgi:micrococcal nuclease